MNLLTGTQKKRAFDNANTVLIIDNFRYFRIGLKTFTKVLITWFVLFALIFLAIYFSSIEIAIYEWLYPDNIENFRPNKQVVECYLGITSPCYLGGVIQPVEVVDQGTPYIDLGGKFVN